MLLAAKRLHCYAITMSQPPFATTTLFYTKFKFPWVLIQKKQSHPCAASRYTKLILFLTALWWYGQRQSSILTSKVNVAASYHKPLSFFMILWNFTDSKVTISYTSVYTVYLYSPLSYLSVAYDRSHMRQECCDLLLAERQCPLPVLRSTNPYMAAPRCFVRITIYKVATLFSCIHCAAPLFRTADRHAKRY